MIEEHHSTRRLTAQAIRACIREPAPRSIGKGVSSLLLTHVHRQLSAVHREEGTFVLSDTTLRPAPTCRPPMRSLAGEIIETATRAQSHEA